MTQDVSEEKSSSKTSTERQKESTTEKKTAPNRRSGQTSIKDLSLIKRPGGERRKDRNKVKKRKIECRDVHTQEENHKKAVGRLPPAPPPPPPLPRVSLKSLSEVEDTLVYGEEMLPVVNGSVTHASSPSSSASSSTLSPSTSQPSHRPPSLLPSPAVTLPSPYSRAASLSMCQRPDIKAPPCGPNLSFLPQIDKWLDVALQAADSYYRRKKYGVAASRLHSALQLCSQGTVLADPLHADAEDISLVVSFIEGRLVVCYMKLRRPDLALCHAHRSIQSNPVHFQNHLRQAAVYRLLGEPCAAARSALTADWLYCLDGGAQRHISSLLKLYWQAMLEEALTMEAEFSVMYTPYCGEPSADLIARAEEAFGWRHPEFTGYVYTDPTGGNVLPQTTDWIPPGPSSCPAPSPQNYLLTLGFKSREDGCFLERLHTRTWPHLTGRPSLSGSPALRGDEEEEEAECDWLRRKVLPVLDVMRATRTTVPPSQAEVCAGSGLMERLRCAEALSRVEPRRGHSATLHRCLAQVVTAPYLQEDPRQPAGLLQTLMTDIMDTLEGGRRKRPRVWNEMHKVGQFEDLVYSLEKSFLKSKAHRTNRKRKSSRMGGPTALSNEASVHEDSPSEQKTANEASSLSQATPTQALLVEPVTSEGATGSLRHKGAPAPTMSCRAPGGAEGQLAGNCHPAPASGLGRASGDTSSGMQSRRLGCNMV